MVTTPKHGATLLRYRQYLGGEGFPPAIGVRPPSYRLGRNLYKGGSGIDSLQ